jgi:hypothetical protein
MTRNDVMAAYSNVMDAVDALRDEEAKDMDSFRFIKLDEAFQALEDARDTV